MAEWIVHSQKIRKCSVPMYEKHPTAAKQDSLQANCQDIVERNQDIGVAKD